MTKADGKKGKTTARNAATGKWLAPRSGGYSARSFSGRLVKRSAKTRRIQPPAGRAGASAAKGSKE